MLKMFGKRELRRTLYNYDFLMMITFTLMFCVIKTLQAHYRIHVVTVQKKIYKFNYEFCSKKCTGTLLTQTLVLSAASCTEETPYDYGTQENNDGDKDKEGDKGGGGGSKTNTNGTSTGNTTNINSNNNLNHTYGMSLDFKEGDIKIFARNTVKTNLYANVTEKFLHPEWNPKNFVADFILLKLNKRFHLLGELPNIMNNNMLHLPNTLMFRGFGKRVYGKTQTEDKYLIYTENANDNYVELPTTYNREFKNIEFNLDQCPHIVNEKTDKDMNWWSFLCMKSVPSKSDEELSTLCDRDVGGPLYELTGNDQVPKLYGVYSHRYHPSYPVCAKTVCNFHSNAIYPCLKDKRLFYKFTALIGRYTFWLNRTIELMEQMSTVTATRKCPIPTTQINHVETTTDTYYEIDKYENSARLMVPNKQVCKIWKGTSSGAGRLVHYDLATGAAIYVLTLRRIVLTTGVI